MHCREILFTPRCSLRAREFPRSLNFFVRRTVAEPRGVNLPNFWILAFVGSTCAPTSALLVLSENKPIFPVSDRKSRRPNERQSKTNLFDIIADDLESPLKVISATINGFVVCTSKIQHVRSHHNGLTSQREQLLSYSTGNIVIDLLATAKFFAL